MSDEPTPQSKIIPILIVFILAAAVAGVLYAKQVRDGGESESSAIKKQCPCSAHAAPPPVADAAEQ
jgi:hypothetical protein